MSVLVVEASSEAGGLASTREFYPGFNASVAHTASHFSSKVVNDLNLVGHGLELGNDGLPLIGLSANGDHVQIRDGDVHGVANGDAQQYRNYSDMLARFARALAPFWMKTMPRIGDNTAGELLTFAQLGLRLRMLGREDMREFMRVATLPMRDLMDEFFDSELLKATLSWDGLAGAKLAPRSPNNAVFALLYQRFDESSARHVIPVNGMAGLIDALVAAARAAGAQLRCEAPVARICIDADESGLRATAVELDSGELIEARRVISCADPQRTFLQLLGAQYLEIEFANRIKRLRCEGFVAKLHLALSAVPQFPGLDIPDGRMIVAPTMDSIEFAFDDAKYGHYSHEPVMECVIPTLRQPSLAPAGCHVLSAHVMYVPARLKGGWTEQARAALTGRLLDQLQRYAPGLKDLVLHAELLTPEDLERSHRVTGGHWHHTEFSVDQMLMMRPTYEAAQYATPIPGLYLCGAGSHPGGGVVGAPGHNAARAILK
jgi:phytoene dehydrogenase-like protein